MPGAAFARLWVRTGGAQIEYAHEGKPMIQISESAQVGMSRKLIAPAQVMP